MSGSVEFGFDTDGEVVIVFKTGDLIDDKRSVPIDEWKRMALEMERAIANL